MPYGTNPPGVPGPQPALLLPAPRRADNLFPFPGIAFSRHTSNGDSNVTPGQTAEPEAEHGPLDRRENVSAGDPATDRDGDLRADTDRDSSAGRPTGPTMDPNRHLTGHRPAELMNHPPGDALTDPDTGPMIDPRTGSPGLSPTDPSRDRAGKWVSNIYPRSSFVSPAVPCSAGWSLGTRPLDHWATRSRPPPLDALPIPKCGKCPWFAPGLSGHVSIKAPFGSL